MTTSRCLALAIAATLAAPALASPSDPPLPPTQGDVRGADKPAAGPTDLPPYEADLERLSERIGTLALLRELCHDGDAAAWRDRMNALLAAEAGSGPRRDRLVAAFNRGFRGYAASYRTCTPSARIVIARSLAECERLTRDLATRYSGT